MESRILPDLPEESELVRWASEDGLDEPSHSNIVSFVSPDEEYTLRVQMDDPVRGYLVQLYAADREEASPIARTIVDDRELALNVATHMAAAADDLDALADHPRKGPETIHESELFRGGIDVPDEWESQEWHDALETAYDEANLSRAKGTLVTKTIDGRDYYYLQWRDGDSVKSQSVAPVSPPE